MLGQALPVLAFAALAQARAFVTNHCSYPVYIWSIPQVLSGSHTNNLSLKPQGQYQEPWRHGSSMNPGVAIKVSTKGGSTSVTCRFAPGQNSWSFWQPGQRYSERGYGDCKTIGWNGEFAYMDSHFEITPNGAAVMTCH